ncbi:MAG: hypothetical protein ACOCW7_04405, partial [Bacteroidota bacterium]
MLRFIQSTSYVFILLLLSAGWQKEAWCSNQSEINILSDQFSALALIPNQEQESFQDKACADVTISDEQTICYNTIPDPLTSVVTD